jgi:IMP dehydrogenase
MIKQSYSFDDLLLVPRYSEIESRSLVNTNVEINGIIYSQPIIPANMKTVISLEMATQLASNKSLAILHRFMNLEEQLDMVKNLMQFGAEYFAVSVGVLEKDKSNIGNFYDAGVRIFCIDIAHGDSKHCIEMIKFIKQFANTTVIAGNVATGEGASRLWKAGADIVKVGIGGGSTCLTRVRTANGVAQMSAIMEVYEVKQKLEKLYNKKYYFISDGGCKEAGDICKALCFADMVMVGNLFAGTKEAPGNLITTNKGFFKEYVGSSTHKSSYVEGVKGMVPYKGDFADVLEELLEGIRSCCSYQGVNNLKDLKEDPQFLQISSSGLKESKAHDIEVFMV